MNVIWQLPEKSLDIFIAQLFWNFRTLGGFDFSFSGLKGSRPKLFFSKVRGFLLISFDWCVVILYFFFERKDMILGNMLDTQKIVVERQKNFLRQFEVHLHAPKAVFFAPRATIRWGSGISWLPWVRKTAFGEWRWTSNRRRKSFWRPTTMF